MRLAAHSVVFVVLAGCAADRPPARPSVVSVNTPRESEPEAPAPPPSETAPESGVPEGLWRVTYLDGSGNEFQFENTEGSVSYTYTPVAPERSSSGTYSGGTPLAGKLTPEHVAALWKRLSELEKETDSHTGERAMGTGAFRIVTPAGERSFIVQRGELLAAFDDVLSGMKLGN